MKNVLKIIPLVFSLVVFMSSTVTTLACTGIYVGGESSENGSTFFGRSEDLSDNNTKVFGISEAKDWEPGTLYTDADGFTREMPEHTYKYTFVRDSNNNTPPPVDANGNVVGQAYPEVGQNEHGVSVSATVSTATNPQVMAVDPAVNGGITEASLASVILERGTSARDAVEKLAALLDTTGAGQENNSLMIGDSKEVWIFEILTGHQYVAKKMENKGVMVQPNMILLGIVDTADVANVIASKDLISVAQEAGTYVGNGTTIDIAQSYSGDYSDESKTRYWQGVNYIDPEKANGFEPSDVNVGSANAVLLHDVKKKLSTFDVLRILGYRGEGSKYDSNADSNIYPIGNENQMEVHVMEIRHDMPKELATLQWQAIADGELNVYVPYYTALITDVNVRYKYEPIEKFEHTATATEGSESINGIFNRINDLNNKNRDAGMTSMVQEYFDKYQKAIIDKQAEIDMAMLAFYQHSPAMAQVKATEYGIQMSELVFKMAVEVYQKMQAYVEAGNYVNPLDLGEIMDKTPTVEIKSVEMSELVEAETIPAGNGNSQGITGAGSTNSANANSSVAVKTVKKTPNTGDTGNLMAGVMIVILAWLGVALMFKTKKNL